MSPDRAELAALLAGGQVTYRPTCHLVDDNNVAVEDLTSWLELGGQVERGNYQTVHSQCSFTIARPLNWCRDRVRLGMWVGPYWYGLGVYLVSVPTTVAGRYPKVWQVDGYDLLETVAHPHGQTFVAEQGAGHLATARGLLEQAGLKVEFAGMGDDLPLERDRPWPIDPETTTLNIVNELLQAAGWQAVWADRDGTLRAGRYVSPADRPPDWVYSTGAGSTVGVERKLTRDYFRVPNRWVFIRDDPEGGEPVEGDGVYVVENVDQGPTSQMARGRTISKVEQRNVASHAALVASGDRTVEADRSVADEVELKVAANPAHWHFDVIRLDDPELGVDRRFVQRRWVLPLDGSDMTIDARGV